MAMSVILADDQSKVRFALRILLESRRDVKIAAEVDDAYELLEQLAVISPEVIIIDWLLPDLAEIGSIEAIRKLCPDAAIIALSGRPELEQQAISNGVDAFVSKIDPPDKLQDALDAVESRLSQTESHHQIP